jgi:uncharacterized protein with HEPN domain
MQRSVALRISDMIHAGDRCVALIAGLNEADFRSVPERVEAVAFNIIVLGEAAASIPVAFQDDHSTVPWRAIKAMRNRLAHEYFQVDSAIVWATVNDDLPDVLMALGAIQTLIANLPQQAK